MAKICNACARSWIFLRGYGRDILALNNVHIFCQPTIYSIYIHINNSTRKMTMRQTSSWNQKANYKYLGQQKRIPQSHNPTLPKTHPQISRCLFEVTTFHTGIQHTAIGHLGGSKPVAPSSSAGPTPWLWDSPTALASRPSSCISSQALGMSEVKKRLNGICVFSLQKMMRQKLTLKKTNKKGKYPPLQKKKRDPKGSTLHSALKTSNRTNELNGKQNLSAVPVALAQYFQLGHRPGVVHWLLQFYRFLWVWGYS